ncbi:metal-dependent hydrolase [Halalkalibacter okhensis]|uniref:Membrane protein n=1 Tax=Halalkalibacter okhensis TaxID=333138 RepID=A0A0B0IJ22_9BACI|nr:metal-dependent hydrolase [Halalkalibacter okhensis]KHF41290.1 membrane protein [Halalkalibacter okhensis]
MDTGTHVVMGVALGGLATLSPTIANDPLLPTSVMIATIIGSQAPDFDTVLKLRNNAVYIRNHRGITHSVPALFIWPLLVTSGILLFTPETNWSIVLLWSFIAVFLHVFVDIFNAYGTQALRPFSNKWIALGIINIFDPFIFFSHLVAFGIWGLGLARPGPTILLLYLVLIGYYIWRIGEKQRVVNHAKKLHPDASHIFVSPTIRWNQWHVVIRTPDIMFVTESRNHKIEYFEQYSFDPIPDIPVINAARKDPNLSAFLSFSPSYRWEVEDKEDNVTEVRFVDLRYRSKGHYPFVAIVQLDQDLNILSSYTGWVFSEETLQKKLNIVTE